MTDLIVMKDFQSTCNRYNTQNIGETVHQLCSRWSNNKSASRKHSQGATCIQHLDLILKKESDKSTNNIGSLCVFICVKDKYFWI